MNAVRLSRLWLTALLLFNPAYAGRSCEQQPLSVAQVQERLQLALQVRNYLQRSGAQLALVARQGQDLDQYHLRYSHAAWAWLDGGRWRVSHLLNQCGTADAALYDQGLGQFFLEADHRRQALIAIPSPALQQRLRQLLIRRQDIALLQPRYNLLAYPWSTEYQNSNQWLLEVLAAAYSNTPITQRAPAQAWLQQAGYQPSELSLPAYKRLGAELTRAQVSFNDHPSELRFTGRIRVSTVNSLLQWWQVQEPALRIVELP